MYDYDDIDSYDNDELTQVYTHDGKLITIPFEEYINNLTYYNNNLSRVLLKQQQKEYFTKVRTELERINRELKRLRKESRYSYGHNFTTVELEIDKLEEQQKRLLSILNTSK